MESIKKWGWRERVDSELLGVAVGEAKIFLGPYQSFFFSPPWDMGII
jgi:hypothetical protein